MTLRSLAILFLTLSFAAGCTSEIAQTATLRPAGELDCAMPGGLSLPRNGAFGSGDEPASELVGGDYGEGDGPGLTVTARDAFRVTLNGALVVESTVARERLFVPLSLLPGENALSVVVSARQGTPAALVHLDELERATTSDASWKVSVDPEEGFANAGFDDSSWADATDYGAPGALPGCDPDTFPDSSARWIGPELESGTTAVLRKTIRIAPSGYGRETTGGEGATPLVVTTWDELVAAASSDEPAVIVLADGVHDFRTEPREQPACPAVCTNDASRTRYTVIGDDETCAEELVTMTRDEQVLSVASNKTIVGLGRGARLRGAGFVINDAENVIVRNVAFYDVNPELADAGTALFVEASRRLWFDHLTIKWVSDGFTSMRGDTADVTLSYVRYDGVNDNVCRGQHTLAASVSDSTATFHHCFFDHVESHSPRADGAAEVHVYDNLFADNPGYAVGSICGAEVLVESNTFERVRTPTTRDRCADMTEPMGLIDFPEGSNQFGEDVGEHGMGGMEPHDMVFTPPYMWELDDSDDGWLEVLKGAGAGSRWHVLLSLD